MVEYTIDDIRGPTVAREMAQLKEFVLAKFNGAIADAEAAAAAAANAVLANTVKKTGEASQSIAGNVGVTGTLDAAAIGSGSTPIVCGDLTAFGSVSLDDTVLQGNLTGADSSALINLAGVGSVLVPAPTSNGEAATKKYVDDALDAYAPMLRTTGNQTMSGIKVSTSRIDFDSSSIDLTNPPSYSPRGLSELLTNNGSKTALRSEVAFATGGNTLSIILHGADGDGNDINATLQLTIFRDGDARLQLVRPNGTVMIVPKG